MFMLTALPLLASLQPHGNDAALAGLAAAGCMVWFVVLLTMVIFPIFCFWRIFAKAGYNGAMALAFGIWPAGQKG